MTIKYKIKYKGAVYEIEEDEKIDFWPFLGPVMMKHIKIRKVDTRETKKNKA